ncbi:hypothetical protein H0H92_011785 [Tricholoma furcatifolium]|nr:hypothetical protein H0H92_011785 [Tricholoma furcatifolium]
MSSFKRKGSVKQAQVFSGTRVSPATSSTTITSTGIPSLDDILGGGLPLSCSLLIAAPDLHSSYGDLVQKYFTAQGLYARHRLYVVDDQAEAFVKDIMWSPAGKSGGPPDSTWDEDDKHGQQEDQKIKIAWRYEQMKPFQTTVSTSSSSSNDEYCNNFDLGSRVPASLIQKAQQGYLTYLNVQPSYPGKNSISESLNRIRGIFSELSGEPSPIRICIPSLGSPQWGEISHQEILYFLHTLRALLRENPTACASISLAPHLSTETWGGRGWLQKLGWVTDAAFTLSAFSAPHSILPPSDKFSTLRGLAASAGGTGGSGENNLTFKSTRKRLIFETLHLDIEGGVGERRTTPSATTVENVIIDTHDQERPGHTSEKKGFAAVKVAVETLGTSKTGLNEDGANKGSTDEPKGKPKKSKKTVAFRADRPDLYDF